MAVILEGTIRRYLGTSSDAKSQSGVEDTIPAGSSFMETDTGRIYRYNGEGWRFAEPADETAMLLTVIYLELQAIRAAVELTVTA